LPDADFIAACAHKAAPLGIGVLLVKDLGTLEPVGGQENRRGTQDAPNALAAALAAKPMIWTTGYARTKLEDGVAAGGVVIGEGSPRSDIGAVSMRCVERVAPGQFDLAGIAVSAEAPAVGQDEGKRVLRR
jgi:cysteine desulfurase